MSELISNGQIVDEERPGRSLNCPSCEAGVNYTVLNLVPGDDVFLYCDSCSNFTLREEDRASLNGIDPSGNSSLVDQLSTHYAELEKKLPACGCGGHFRVWSNVKCPACKTEFPYNNGVKSEQVRLTDGNIIWIEGAVAYRGKNIASNRLVQVSN